MRGGFRYSFIIIERPDSLDPDELSGRLRRLAELGYQGAELQLVPTSDAVLDRLERSLSIAGSSFPPS